MRRLRFAAVAAVVFWAATAPGTSAQPSQPSRWSRWSDDGPDDGPYEAAARALARALASQVGRPEAVASLAGLLRLEDVLPPERLGPLLRTVADDRASDPLVAAQASYHLAIDEQRQGQDALAAARWRTLGLLDQAWVVGPFDAQGRSGMGLPHIPEGVAPDPRRQQRFTGKEREVGWRRLGREAVRQGAILLDAALRPDSDAVAYLVAVVDSDRERAAALRLGSAGPVKVWVDGVPVLERNVVRVAALDQDAAAVRLRKGANWIVVKTLITSGAWRIFLRLTDLDGRALSGLSTRGEPAGRAPRLRSAAPQPGRPVTGVRELGALLRFRAEAASAGQAQEAWLDLARFLALVQPDDVDAKTAEAAAGRAPDRGEALLLLGEVAKEEDDRRAALERATTVGPAPVRGLAHVALGDLARTRRRDAAAATHWRAALAADPSCWPATLALAAEEQSAGLPSAALVRMAALPAAVRATPRVARARVRLLEALGRRTEAEAITRALYRVRRTDIGLAQDLAVAARHRGEPARAAALWREAIDRRPDLSFMVTEAARALEGAGDAMGARQVLVAAVDRLPDDPRLHEELGKLLARMGRLPEAVVALGRTLALRPQNPTLRRYLGRLTADAGGEADRAAAAQDLAQRHAEEAEPLARAALAPPGAGSGNVSKGGDAGVVLLDRRVVRVHVNGLSETFVQRVVHVRTERAVRESQESHVRYTPGTQEVEIRRARVFRTAKTGELVVSEATGRDDRDLSEPWYGLFYDNRAEVVIFEDLRAGDVIEVQYTVADVAGRNEMADYFGDLQLIAETWPKRRWDYTVIAPAGRRLHFNDPRLPGLERTTLPSGDEVIHRFAARNVAKVDLEPSMPGFAEVAPYLHVSTYASWEAVGRWYWSLVEDQLAANDAVRKAAATAVRGLRTDEEKVRALHRFVVETTRYVGLEFGIHGYKPYKVSQVLSRRFGDCKDKAALLVTLLREVGVAAELVLLRTRRGGRLDTVPASLAVFDHAIAYVPALQLYLDGTAEFSGMSELPSQDQGVTVLRVAAGRSLLTQTPVASSAANRAHRTWHVELDPDGGARIAEDLTITGQAAPEWRAHYQTAGERQERFSKVWNGRFPGAQLESVEFVGLEDRNLPVKVRSRIRAPRVGEVREGGRLLLPTTSRESDFVRSYARLSRRTMDLVIAYPWQHEEEVVYRIPDGWGIEHLPAVRRTSGAFGRFALEATLDDGGRVLRVRSLVDVVRHRIPPGEYDAFRKFLGIIDGALGERVVLRKAGG